MKLLRALAALLLSTSLALAAPQATVNLASPTGTVGMGADGSANLVAGSLLCGATSSATMWAVCANQAFVDAAGHLGVTPGTTTPAAGAGTTLQIKASAGTLWSVYAQSTVAGYILCFNTTSAPTTGTTITVGTASGNLEDWTNNASTGPTLSFAGQIAHTYSVGIYCAFTTTAPVSGNTVTTLQSVNFNGTGQ